MFMAIFGSVIFLLAATMYLCVVGAAKFKTDAEREAEDAAQLECIRKYNEKKKNAL